jgi:hypothetical protein
MVFMRPLDPYGLGSGRCCGNRKGRCTLKSMLYIALIELLVLMLNWTGVLLFTEQDSELLATSFDPEKMRDNCDSHRTSHPQTRDRNLIVNCTALRWWQNRCISET